MNSETHWAREIAHEARLEAIDHADPLVPGERIAWSECDYGHTAGFSFVHRVKDELSTQCNQAIPAPIKRVPMDLSRMLKPCLACAEAMKALWKGAA